MRESRLQRDLGHGQVALRQKLLCIVDPAADHVFVGGKAERGPKVLIELGEAEIGDAREISERDPGLPVLLDVLGDPSLEPGAKAAPRGPRPQPGARMIAQQ